MNFRIFTYSSSMWFSKRRFEVIFSVNLWNSYHFYNFYLKMIRQGLKFRLRNEGYENSRNPRITRMNTSNEKIQGWNSVILITNAYAGQLTMIKLWKRLELLVERPLMVTQLKCLGWFVLNLPQQPAMLSAVLERLFIKIGFWLRKNVVRWATDS